MFIEVRHGKRNRTISEMLNKLKYREVIVYNNWKLIKNSTLIMLYHFNVPICVIKETEGKIIKIGGISASDCNAINTMLDFFEIEHEKYATISQGKLVLKEKK